MKNTLTILFITILLGTIITGCGTPSDDNNPIVGTWQMVSLSSGGEEKTADEYMASAQLDNIPQLVFEGDGTVTFDTGETSGAGKWSNEDGKYAILDYSKSKEEPIVTEIVLDNNQLFMEQLGYQLVFEKQ